MVWPGHCAARVNVRVLLTQCSVAILSNYTIPDMTTLQSHFDLGLDLTCADRENPSLGEWFTGIIRAKRCTSARSARLTEASGTHDVLARDSPWHLLRVGGGQGSGMMVRELVCVCRCVCICTVYVCICWRDVGRGENRSCCQYLDFP